MKKSELRDAVRGIHLSEEVKGDMIKHVKEETERKQKHGKAAKWQKTAAAAAIVVVAGGVIAFPVRAFISSFYMGSVVQVRMEDMSEEESKKLLEDIDNTDCNIEAEADSYSREYTVDEKERMKNLYQQYKQGVFPEKELQMAYNEEEAEQYELCYLANGRRFCLPERELTDEEMLEIIEFDVKRDYVLRERYEEMYADELASEKEKENAELEAIMANGGITEEQAIGIAKGYLQDIYGITGEGLELLSHYSSADNLEEKGCYLVEWCDAPLHERNYLLLIRARDGQLIGTTYTDNDYFEQEKIKAEEAESKIPELHEKAVAFMKEKMGISFEKEHVYYETYEDNGITTNKTVKFIFSYKDDGIYEVEYLWNGGFCSYWKGGSWSHLEPCDTDLSEYEDGKISYDERAHKFVISTFRQLDSN
ncbi:MAG: hypothetical protein HDT41_06400 [Lachnospiraceae bacterium]|nr:hypothetical protein [Lachnospiraceae bacterium]